MVGFGCAIATPFVVKQGGTWVFVGALLVAVSVGCDRLYPVAAELSGVVSRRRLVFVPLAARLSEAAWLYGYWKLGVPVGVVVAAGGLSLTHEYLRARGQIAGLRDVGIATLGERPSRSLTTLAGYGIAGVVGLAATAMSAELATGIITIAAMAWLLLAVLGLVQLAIVMAAALRR